MDNYDINDMMRRMLQIVRRGNIHSVQAKPPRCRVTFGTDPVSGDEHVSDWLLWHAHSDSERSDWSMPAVGSPATVFSEGGDLRNGVVFPGLITDDQTPAGTTPTEHVTRFSNGARFAYDTASNAAEVSLPGGGTVKIIGDGGITLDGPVTITKTLTVNETAEIKGDLSSGGNIEATGDITDKDGAGGSMQRLREIYDDHDHEYDDGTTGKPNQKM